VNYYETVFVVVPELEGEKYQKILDKVKELVSNGGGQIIAVQDWGVKRMAYRINGNERGHYCLVAYSSDGKVPESLIRQFRVTEEVVRFLTVNVPRSIAEADSSIPKEKETPVPAETKPVDDSGDAGNKDEDKNQEEIAVAHEEEKNG